MWNSQYRCFSGVHESVLFAQSFPGLVTITDPEKISIGCGSVINAWSTIHSAGGVSIGQFTHIGHGLTIYSSNHNYRSQESIPYDEIDILKPVVIEDCVWIGSNVSIVPGVRIGEGSVVGMGAIVTKDVPRGSIVGGNPAKVIGSRDMVTYERLKAQGKCL
jgi:acetyltransferase-like isoleucine patch superfamily enzyme